MKQLLALTVALSVTSLCLAQAPTEPPPVAPAPGHPAAPEPKGTGTRSVRGSPRGVTVTADAVINLMGKSSRGDSIPPVVIRFSSSDAKANAELEQDLYVMARVLSRMLERSAGEKVEWKMNVPMLLTGAGKSVRPMYIEGTGPLFMIKVNFPLMPPPKAAPASANAPGADSEWTEAERDLFGEEDGLLAQDSPASSGFNEEQVELLKRELLGALKNGTNIRGLKPDEFINIAVFGQPNARRGKPVELSSSRGGRTASYAELAGGAGKGTVLTLRVRKSDIDDFAGGKFDFDAFKARVTTAAYLGSGAGQTSINSWLQDASKSWRQ